MQIEKNEIQTLDSALRTLQREHRYENYNTSFLIMARFIELLAQFSEFQSKDLLLFQQEVMFTVLEGIRHGRGTVTVSQSYRVCNNWKCHQP